MSKTSYLLIILVLVCLGTYLYIKYFLPARAHLPVLVEEVKNHDSTAQGTLILSPATQTLSAGQTSKVDVVLNTQNATPTVLQFEISYDPLSLMPTQIVPGRYFTNPIVLLNTINPRNGRISYALKCSADYTKDQNADCGNVDSEHVAQIIFTVNPYAVTKQSSLNIMPKTLLETRESKEVKLQTTNAKIMIQGAVLLQATPSAVIVQ